MIGPIRIQNFKSIRDLSIQAKRVNVFIGEPNTGKSNIIEAMAFFCPETFSSFNEVFRFKTTADLYFDQKVSSEILLQAGTWGLTLTFKGTEFHGVCRDGTAQKGTFSLSLKGLSRYGVQPQTGIRYYSFKPLDTFVNVQPGSLNPPFGDNLVALLYTNENLRQRVGGIFREKGFRLQLKPTENELLITKDMNDELYSYPWTSVSETMRRVVFFMAVLETNRKSTLLLDEPESNTFPFYTKYLAERIALDETNQFLLTTHNPYLLSSIVEKTPPKDLAVFVTRMEKFETKVKPIPDKSLPELLELDSDAFFNLERLAGE